MSDGNSEHVQVAILGAGPAGIGAAVGLARQGVESVMLIDRAAEPGGLPASYRIKQRGVPTFVVFRRGRIMYGIEYVNHLIAELRQTAVRVLLKSSVIGIDRPRQKLQILNPERGSFSVTADAFVVATGTRERTAAERGWIAGARGARIWHTLDILRLLDRLEKLPGRYPVILGSDLIAYATAAKLKAAGAERVALVDTSAKPRAHLLAQLYFRRWVQPDWFGATSRAELISDRGHLCAIRLDRDRRVGCDTVVISGDLVPNSELLIEAGFEVQIPDRIPMTWARNQLGCDGWFAAGGILGGFRGADSCYRSGLSVAKTVVRYLKTVSNTRPILTTN